MRHITSSNRGFVRSLVVVSLAALGLAGCGSNSVTAFDLSTDIPAMTCDRPVGNDTWSEVSSEISKLDASSAPGERNQLRDWGLDPEADLEPARKALQAKAEECPKSVPSTSPSASQTTAACDTWVMKRSDYGPNNRWFADGIVEIKNAKTTDQARDAINIWVNQVKTDPALLADSALFFLDKNVDQTGLFKDDCATNAAVTLFNELTLELALSDMTPDKAPANGVNTGATTAGVHRSSQNGITGDRRAIKIERKNGKIVWIMWRCGNVVTIETFDLPVGKTDNPPKTPPTTEECVEIPNNGVVDCGGAKVESDEPQRRGNVPTQVQGGSAGLPESNASEPEVTRPKATTVNTPPPAPKPSETKRPAPPPPVEPSAPPTSNPEPSPTVDPCTVNPDFCD